MGFLFVVRRALLPLSVSLGARVFSGDSDARDDGCVINQNTNGLRLYNEKKDVRAAPQGVLINTQVGFVFGFPPPSFVSLSSSLTNKINKQTGFSW